MSSWTARDDGGCFVQVMANEGLKGLFRGFEPAIVRAVPANATAFLVYELAKDALTKN